MVRRGQYRKEEESGELKEGWRRRQKLGEEIRMSGVAWLSEKQRKGRESKLDRRRQP